MLMKYHSSRLPSNACIKDNLLVSNFSVNFCPSLEIFQGITATSLDNQPLVDWNVYVTDNYTISLLKLQQCLLTFDCFCFCRTWW